MALLDPEVDDFRVYKYTVKSFNLIFPNSPEYENNVVELDSHRIQSFVVIDNYIENIYPIVDLTISIEDSLYDRIIEFKDDVRFHIDMRKKYTDMAEGRESLGYAHMNKTFSLILDDTVRNVNRSLRNAEFPEGDTDELMGIRRIEEFFLFAADMVVTNTTQINAILRNVTPAIAISKILHASGIRKNLIMPIAHNNALHSRLVIPPLRLTRAFSFIDAYYGLYRTGAITYFGITRNYIIPYCIRSRAVEYGEPEVINVVVPRIGSIMTDTMCSVIKFSEQGTQYVIADSNSFQPGNSDVSNSILYPNEIDVMNNEYGALSTENSSKEKNKKLVLNPGENPFYKEAYELRKLAVSMVISIFVKDCDLEVFTPNKVYQFLFEDTKLMKKYKGIYHLVSKTTAYTKEAECFMGGANLVFHKNVK